MEFTFKWPFSEFLFVLIQSECEIFTVKTIKQYTVNFQQDLWTKESREVKKNYEHSIREAVRILDIFI